MRFVPKMLQYLAYRVRHPAIFRTYGLPLHQHASYLGRRERPPD